MELRMYAHDVCDFCSDPWPTWSCPCDTYVEDWLGTRSLDAWLACDECAALILANRWAALAARGMRVTTATELAMVEGEEAALAHIARLHRGYRKHARGAPQKMKVRVQ